MPSKRTQRRAFERYGEIVYEEENVGKHSKARRKRKPKKPSLKAQRKLRNLYLRADILVLPYGEREVKVLLQKARKEFDEQGMITIKTSVELVRAGQNVYDLEALWKNLKDQNIDPTFKKPTEENDNV